MTEPTPLRRPRQRPAALDHNDVTALIATMQRQTEIFEQLVEHVPVLIEMAQAWDAGKTAGRAVGRTARWAGTMVRWASSLAVSIALLWAVFTHRWDALLGIHHN